MNKVGTWIGYFKISRRVNLDMQQVIRVKFSKQNFRVRRSTSHFKSDWVLIPFIWVIARDGHVQNPWFFKVTLLGQKGTTSETVKWPITFVPEISGTYYFYQNEGNFSRNKTRIIRGLGELGGWSKCRFSINFLEIF